MKLSDLKEVLIIIIIVMFAPILFFSWIKLMILFVEYIDLPF